MQISTPRRSRDKDAAHQGYTVNAVTCRNGEEPDRRGAGRGGDPTAQRTSETGRGDQARPALEAAIRAVMSASSCLHTAAIRAVMSAHCLGESRIGADENTHSQQRPTLDSWHERCTERPRSASCLQAERRASNEASCTCSSAAKGGFWRPRKLTFYSYSNETSS